VEKLIFIGKEKGYLTCDEMNEHLPADLLSKDQMDDAMSMFGDMDIEIIDSAKKIKYQKKKDIETPDKEPRDKKKDKEQKTPTDGNANDAVRLYLREKRSTPQWLSRNHSCLPNVSDPTKYA